MSPRHEKGTWNRPKTHRQDHQDPAPGYPDSRTALVYETPLQILVATILAAQCTDERVNMITPGLFGKYPTAADFATADRAALETEIRSDRLFPQQGQEHHRRGEEDRGEFRG